MLKRDPNARYLTLLIALVGSLLSQSHTFAAANTNILNQLCEMRSLRLSSIAGPSFAHQFEFTAKLENASSAAMILRVVAGQGKGLILTETTNGLPYSLAANGLFICCDPKFRPPRPMLKWGM
jgi:hypothetical protein